MTPFVLIAVSLGILLILGSLYLVFNVYIILKKFEKEAMTEVSKAKLDFDATLTGIFKSINGTSTPKKSQRKEAEKCEPEEEL